MKRQEFIYGMSAILGSVVFGSALSACGGGGDSEEQAPRGRGPGSGGNVPTDATPSQDIIVENAPSETAEVSSRSPTLDEKEIAGLKFMREEEKLAHDVYVAMYAKWRRNVFSNIAASETQHTNAVLGQLKMYGIADPAAGRAPGEFEDEYLQALYNRLVAMGNVSLEEAIKVGCLIEETDIQDIRNKMAETDEPSILKVYQNLICGSYNHLQAFDRQLKTQYTAQVIPQSLYDAIAAGAVSC